MDMHEFYSHDAPITKEELDQRIELFLLDIYTDNNNLNYIRKKLNSI